MVCINHLHHCLPVLLHSQPQITQYSVIDQMKVAFLVYARLIPAEQTISVDQHTKNIP